MTLLIKKKKKKKNKQTKKKTTKCQNRLIFLKNKKNHKES